MDYTVFEPELLSCGVSFSVGEGLAGHTTVCVGGSADYFVKPRTVAELIKCRELAMRCGVPCIILGRGSNVLVSDSGLRGAVLSTEGIDEIYVERVSGEDVYVRAFCGVALSRLLGFCVKNRLSGTEFLFGIPGSVGGAIYMNAGCMGRAIGDITASVFSIQNERLTLLGGKECSFEYRSSAFQKGGACIVSALFRTKKATFDEIEEKLAVYRAMRTLQPKGKSMGSVFKNGEIPAARAIDACGLKGMRIGGAVVSEVHANFIINDGNASATDVYCLIKTVKALVKERLGLTLCEEIRYIGEFR